MKQYLAGKAKNVFLSNKGARHAVAHSLGEAASVPSPGSPSLNNSLGASDASGQVIPYLDDILKDLASPEAQAFKSEKDFISRQFAAKAKRYSNSVFVEDEKNLWDPTTEDLKTVSIALSASISVYDNSSEAFSYPGFDITLIRRISPSMSGLKKATKIYNVRGEQCNDDALPALVIAIRGTVFNRPVDWLVNFNEQLRDSGNVLNLTPNTLISEPEIAPSGIRIHSGFCNGVLEILPEIKRKIYERSKSGSIGHVILTGHSAGGAIASLVYLHLLRATDSEYHNLRLSLVTYGSPPVASHSLSGLIHQLSSQRPRPGMALAMVNDGDAITQADKDYILSLIKLYNSNINPKAITYSSVPEKPTWPLPEPQKVFTVGNIVVLKRSARDGVDFVVRGYHTKPELMRRTIFCDFGMHDKQVYRENIEMIAKTLSSGLKDASVVPSRLE